MLQCWYGEDWSAGWRHELLGFAALGVGLLMIASTDCLLAFLWGPVHAGGTGGRDAIGRGLRSRPQMRASRRTRMG